MATSNPDYSTQPPPEDQQDRIDKMERRIKALEELIMANFHILSGVPQYVGSLNLILKGD